MILVEISYFFQTLKEFILIEVSKLCQNLYDCGQILKDFGQIFKDFGQNQGEYDQVVIKN